MYRVGVFASVVAFMVAGLFSIIWGAYTNLAYFSGLNALISEYLFFIAPCFLIAGGIFIFIASVATYLDLRQNSCYETFSVKTLLVMALFAELMYFLISYEINKEKSHKLPDSLNASLGLYKHNLSEINLAWINLQKMYSCCGVNNASDWDSAGIARPEICHRNPTTVLSGCLDPLSNSITHEVLGLAILTTWIGLAIVGCIGSLALNHSGYGSFNL